MNRICYILYIDWRDNIGTKTSNAVITAYKSGKVLFQGPSPKIEAHKWLSEQSGATKSKQSATAKEIFLCATFYAIQCCTGYWRLFRSHYSCMCLCGRRTNCHSKKLGVKDSKDLKDATIRSLSKEIVKQNIPYSLLVLRNEKYNKLQKQGWPQGKIKAKLFE